MDRPLDMDAMDDQNDSIQTKIGFITKDPRHDHEKPYTLRYDAGDSIEFTNIKGKSHNVTIHNFRPRQGAQNLEEYGFSVEKWHYHLTETIFDQQDKVKTILYPEIENFLRRKFPEAVGVHIVEHGVSHDAEGSYYVY